jgi:hypothetical protein
MDSIVSLKVMKLEGKRVGARSLVQNTSKVKGRVGALRWGLRRLTSKLITHTD